jgi:hypothetical protein
MNPKLPRLKEISEELFQTANGLAGNKTGTVAVELHKTRNVLENAIRMLETGVTLEDEKKMFRDHLKGQPFNAKRSDEDIESMVEQLTSAKARA